MSQLRVNSITNEAGGNTATINGMTPTADSLQGFRNRIINGEMRIDQRNAGAAVTINSTTSVYSVDRWASRGVASAGVYTIQQSTTAPTGFSNSLLVTVTTQDVSLGLTDQYTITHKIEGFNTADLAWGSGSPVPVTLSFWVRSSVTGTFGGSIANNNLDRCYPFAYTITAANTWQQKFITITDIPSGTWLTNNGTGIFLSLSIGAGDLLQGSAGAWATSYYTSSFGQTNLMATNGATFYITGVQLEAGSVATPFERRPYGTELALCQRYFEKSFNIETAPANGPNLTSFSAGAYSVGMATNRLSVGTSIQFAVRKRAAPTMTRFGNSAGELAWLAPNGTALAFSTNITYGSVNQNNFSFGQQVVDGGAIFCIGHWAASSEL